MKGLLSYNPVEGRRIKLDPRTKLFMVVVISTFMMSGSISGKVIYPRIVLAAVPFILLLIDKRFKAAFLYAGFFVDAFFSEAFLIYSTSGIVCIMITMLSGLVTRFIPCVVMGYYLVTTTKVNEFIAAMERMHAPRAITIPLSVMFRFFPTVSEESSSINDAIRMRALGAGRRGKNPVTLLEYRFVPLMISIVKIGEELSVSALTRGLGGPEKRTNICKIGFGIGDAIFVFLVLTAAVFYSIL